jgi:predicted Zn-dependent protease
VAPVLLGFLLAFGSFHPCGQSPTVSTGHAQARDQNPPRPDGESVRVRKAEMLLRLDRPKEALAALQGLTTAESDFYRGLAFRQLQDHVNARSCFVNAWKSGYRNDYVLYSAIQEDYALHDKSNGLERFQLLLQTYPDSPWVHLLLADAYFAKEQNDSARNEYLAALKRKPDLLEANFRLGYMAFQAGDHESAIHYFQSEVALNPNYVDARVFLAETLLQMDRKKEALVQLRKALALDPTSELVYKRLATTLIDTSQLQEAEQVLDKAKKRFPNEPAFPAQLSRVFTLLNQPREAQKEAEQARQLTSQQHRAQELAPIK